MKTITLFIAAFLISCLILINANGAEPHGKYGYLDSRNFLLSTDNNLEPVLLKPQLVVLHELKPELSQKDVALLKELFHLQGALGHLTWENWLPVTTAPILYKTKTFDYLFNHPDPPKDFIKVYNHYWKGLVYERPNNDSLSYRATFPVNNIETVVITAPEADDNPCIWELQACHELFHIYQYQNGIGIVSPLKNRIKRTTNLHFPFIIKMMLFWQVAG